jgi:hypothetical protein
VPIEYRLTCFLYAISYSSISALALTCNPRTTSKRTWARIVWNEGDRNYNELSAKEYEERRKSGGMGFNGNNEHCVDTFDSDVCGECLS